MGLLDSIKDVAGSAVKAAGDGIDRAREGAKSLARAVERAPERTARGARQALEGAAKVGKEVARDAVGTARRAASQAVEGAKKVGGAAWRNKAEIGFWVGTAALMAAVPLTGGASGAAAGGLMAARGAAIAAKLGQAGRIGSASVRAARAGVDALRTAQGAFGGTRAGSALATGAQKVRDARLALGGTRTGRALQAVQKPALTAATGIAGVNLADTTVRFARGDAGVKDLAIATLAFAPAGIAGVQRAAARRASVANERAADVATGALDDVAVKAATASDEVARVASAAPHANAPLTAGAAADARDEATEVLARAVDLRERTAVTAGADGTAETISASRLVDELDDVAHRAGAARARAADTEELAPDALTPAARAARSRLDEAQALAARTREEVAELAQVQRRAEVVADRADELKDAVGSTSVHVFNVNNGVTAAREQDGFSLTDGSLMRGIGGWLLARNARPVGAAAG